MTIFNVGIVTLSAAQIVFTSLNVRETASLSWRWLRVMLNLFQLLWWNVCYQNKRGFFYWEL